MKEPKVTLISHTADPLETVYAVWMASKNEEPTMTPAHVRASVDPDEVRDLFRRVIRQRIPVGEHIDFVFMVENVSVSWREQAVRHRIGTTASPERVGADIVVDTIPDLADSSFWSQSMRLLNMGTFAERGAFRLPDAVARDERLVEVFVNTMFAIQRGYNVLVEAGVPMEDARELIPLGAQHRISWRLNVSSLQHIVGKRGCVSGDTSIPLLDGRERTMRELLDEYGTDREFWVYSCDEEGNVVPGRARHNGVTQREAEIVEVELDNGEVLRTTPDHRFMVRDGGYVRADELDVGSSLMPLYRSLSDGTSERAQDRIEGYELVYNPGTDDWRFTHRIVAGDSPGEGRTVVHHVDFDKRNNCPSNLEWMRFKGHIALHAAASIPISEATKEKLRAVPREKRAKAGKAAAAKGVLKANSEKAARANRGNTERGKKISKALKKRLASPEARAERSHRAKEQWARPEVRAKMAVAISQAMSGDARSAKREGGVATDGRNHKVVAIRRKGREDVYDLSVDTHHNYATAAGVFVHNCWILQLGIWGPVIEGMINELVTKVDPIFAELVTPPCLDGDDFRGCVYHEENRRRYSGEDAHPPCPLHFRYHHIPESGGKESDIASAGEEATQERFHLPMATEMRERAEAYRRFWFRDPYTGERYGDGS